MDFTPADKALINSFLRRTITLKTLNGLSTKDELWDQTGVSTKHVINRVLRLRPERFGFKGRRLPAEAVPADMVRIDAKESVSGEYGLDQSVYLPPKVFTAYAAMAAAFELANPDRKLLIGSAYRSPAYQIVVLLYILAEIYDFDVAKTLKRVAMPEYSQHCSVTHTALDMLNLDGQPDDAEPQNFSGSIEYDWLIKHAAEFNFRESYPKNNPDGVMWEPWHWQFVA